MMMNCVYDSCTELIDERKVGYTTNDHQALVLSCASEHLLDDDHSIGMIGISVRIARELTIVGYLVGVSSPGELVHHDH